MKRQCSLQSAQKFHCLLSRSRRPSQLWRPCCSATHRAASSAGHPGLALSLLFLLQTKKGRQAKGIAASSFKRLLHGLRPAVGALVKDKRYRRWFPGGRAYYSFDNASAHDCEEVDLSVYGIEGDRRELPPCSGDMHKVIETVHATLQNAVQRELLQNPQRYTGAAFSALVERLFRHEITAARVRQHVRSLPELYRQVVAAEGGYVAPRYW